jgi:hypothetical protein
VGVAVFGAVCWGLHAVLLDALDRGITHFGSFLGTAEF